MTPNCLNCDAPLNDGQAYCDRCGQKVGRPGLTMHEIAHDLMHALIHVDRSAWTLLRALLGRPGHVARDYVDGRRKRYFGPFGFLTVAVAVSSTAIAFSHFSIVPSANGQLVAIADLMREHANLLSLLQVPLLAAACGLFFAGSRRSFAEHLVLTAYTSGIRSLFLALIVLPCWYFVRDDWVLYGYLAVWAAYFGLATSQFYAQRRGRAWLKGVLATVTAEVLASALLSVAVSVFLFRAGRH